MIKTILIIGCILLLLGLIGLDMFISRDLNRPPKKKGSDDKTDDEK
ncbi:MAG: hypothetical protein IJ071_12935 [Ruminococcus sp.]|nr:hypothetical protein [Ruminococcus sp.]